MRRDARTRDATFHVARFAFGLALWCASVGAAKDARASGTFPAVVERVGGAKVACATCHRALDTGVELTPFGAALAARGARAREDASLEAALAKLSADSVDSDGDGARDLDELAWGGDPNVPDLAPTPPEEPRYGFCALGAGGSTGARSSCGWSLGAALVGALAPWARRRGGVSATPG